MIQRLVLALAGAPAFAPAQTGPLLGPYPSVVNVKAMPPSSGCPMAKGDGVTDDAPAFVCAKSYALTLNPLLAGYGLPAPQVYAPAGVYVWKSPIVWDQRVSLMGDGSNATIISYTPATGTALLLNAAVIVNSPATFGVYRIGFVGAGYANATTALNVSCFSLVMEDVAVAQFGLGMTFGNYASFFTASRLIFQLNNQSLLWPAGLTDAGEGINFYNTNFINSMTFGNGVQIQAAPRGGLDFNLWQSAFDNSQLALASRGANVRCIQCHFEVNSGNFAQPQIAMTGGSLTIEESTFLTGPNVPAEEILASDVLDPGNCWLTLLGNHSFSGAFPFTVVSGGLHVVQLTETRGSSVDVSGTTTGFRMLGSLTGAGSRVTRFSGLADGQVPLTSGTTPALDAGKGNSFTLNILANIAVVVAVPVNPPPAGFSQTITVALRNSSGGALGTAPTFNTGAGGFKLNAAVVNPANGTQVEYTFRWDSVQRLWYEIGSHLAAM